MDGITVRSSTVPRRYCDAVAGSQGLLLDDCDERNGPLMVLPRTHKGPTWDHHADGAFCGAIDATCPLLDDKSLSEWYREVRGE